MAVDVLGDRVDATIQIENDGRVETAGLFKGRLSRKQLCRQAMNDVGTDWNIETVIELLNARVQCLDR